jgi:hypothetical protein
MGQRHAPAAFYPRERPIVQEAGWAPGSVWTGAENLAPPGFDPWTVHPGASRYIDWDTRPTNNKNNNLITDFFPPADRPPATHNLIEVRTRFLTISQLANASVTVSFLFPQLAGFVPYLTWTGSPNYVYVLYYAHLILSNFFIFIFSVMCVPFSVLCVLMCVNVYCTTATGCQPNCS